MERLSKHHNLLFFSLLVLTIFIPIYPKLPFLTVNGTYVAIRLEDLLILLIVLFWVILERRNLSKLIKQNITQAFLLFWGIGVLSLISAYFLTESINLKLGFLHFLRRVEVMVLFFVAASAIKNLNQVRVFLIAMLATTLIIVFYGFGQLLLDFPVISTTNREFSKGLILTLTPGARLSSTFAGHYDLAAYLSVALVFLVILWFYFYPSFKQFFKTLGSVLTKKPKLKELSFPGLIVFTSAVTLIGLGLTSARVSFAASFVALALGLLIIGKKMLIGLLFLAAIGTLLVVPDLRHRFVATLTVNLMEGGGAKYEPPANKVNNFTPIAMDEFATGSAERQVTEEANLENGPWNATIAADIAPGEPVNLTELGVYRSFNIRTDAEWPRAIRAFEKNPLLGTGYSSLTLATDNDILRSLGEVGVLGTLALGLIFFILIKRFWLSFKRMESLEKLFLVATICTILNLFLTSLFIDILEASKIASLLWILLGVAWAVSKKYKIKS